MKGEEIDRRSTPWVYRPAEHKTEHHGIEKVIYLGPKSREILTPILAQRPAGWTFPARYSFGKRPTKPVGLYDDATSVTVLTQLPPADAPPAYPSPA